jgi:Fe2+ or Zn2+ uptake regulation protein
MEGPAVSASDRHTDLLRRAKLRVTPQRLAILQALSTGAHVATAQTIWERAHKRTRGLGLVTVYRILERLHHTGLVEQIDLRGVAHFGLAGGHHDHMICERCGRIEALDPCVLDSLAESRLRDTGFLVTGHRLDLLGLCRACQRAS